MTAHVAQQVEGEAGLKTSPAVKLPGLWRIADDAGYWRGQQDKSLLMHIWQAMGHDGKKWAEAKARGPRQHHGEALWQETSLSVLILRWCGAGFWSAAASEVPHNGPAGAVRSCKASSGRRGS